MPAPRGIFGLPHGILSSVDEKIAFGIALVALAFALLYDGELDVRPVSGAAIVGLLVAIVASIAAPPAVTNEWHIPVLVVLVVLGGAVVATRRR
jgi:hypothetical protein